MNAKKMLGTGLSVAFIAGSIFISSCSNKITEEQLVQLKDLRHQEKNLTESLMKKKAENSALEKEIKARKSELNDCSKTSDFIKQKLAQWPNVWPDYNPNAPATEQN
jgi:septal ring factor EnvC (AmiA/AmiB activator)